MDNLPIWNIGGGIKHRDNLIREFRIHKEYLDTNHKLFNYVYDSIFGLKWNGGRICLPQDSMPFEEMIELIKEYNRLGIGFNWSFSNLLIKEEDLKDPYCNLALEATNNSLNGVILTSSLLRDYIRKQYSNMRIIYSVCNGLKEIEDYNKALDNNDIVVLHPDFNHNYSFLDKLKEKDRIEIMVNDMCSFGCPYRKEHYLELSRIAFLQSVNPIINTREEIDSSRTGGCIAVQAGYVKDGRNRINFSDIDNMLAMGFKHFKLIGREHNWDYYYNNDLEPNLKQYFLRRLVKNSNLECHI